MYHREDFLNRIREDSKEVTNQLVFADWLQEQGEVFESELRKAELKIIESNSSIWIKNNLFKSDAEKAEGKIHNIDFKTFEKLSDKLEFESVLVKNKDELKLINLSIISLLWEDGTVKIVGFTKDG